MTARAHILQVALQTFVELGYEQTTTQEICRRAQVSNGSLFHHFANKQALGAALYLEGIQTYQQAILAVLSIQPAELVLAQVVQEHISWLQQHTLLAKFLFERGRPDWQPAHSQFIQQANSQFGQALSTWMAEQMAQGYFRRQSKRVVSALIMGSLRALTQPWLAGQEAELPLALSADLTQSLVFALRG